MTTIKYLSISTLAASLVILAGCTLQPTTESASGGNTNVVTNTNTTNDNANAKVVTNTNATVSNANTDDSNVNSDVGTSDWLTYTNEEYGFSFRYPADWGEVRKKESNDSVQKKEKFYLTFSNQNTPTLMVSSINYEDQKSGDIPSDPNLNLVDFSLSDADLKTIFLNDIVNEVNLERIKINNVISLRAVEFGQNMAGDYQQIKYYIPYALKEGSYHITFIQGTTVIDQFDAMVKTLTIE